MTGDESGKDPALVEALRRADLEYERYGAPSPVFSFSRLNEEAPAVVGEGLGIVAEEEAFWQNAGTQHVRVTRVLVYEGPADRMRRQLSRSLPIGCKDCGAGFTITAYQGPVTVVGNPPTPEPTEG